MRYPVLFLGFTCQEGIMRYPGLFLGLIFIVVGSAHAQLPVGGGSVSGLQGTRVWGHSRSGPIATPQAVASAANQVIRQVGNSVEETGKTLRGGQAEGTAAIVESLDAVNRSARDVEVQSHAATARNKAEDQFGSQSTSYNPCADTETARGNAVAGVRAEVIQGTLNQGTQLYNQSGKSVRDVYRDMIDLEGADKSAESLFEPRNGEEASSATTFVRMITNPVPEAEFPESLKDTPEGRQYEAFRNVKHASLATPQYTLNRIQSQTAPFENERLRQVLESHWAASGMPENLRARGVNDEGKVSFDSSLSAFSRMRYENQDYILNPESGKYAQNEVGLLRDQNVMLALMLVQLDEIRIYTQLNAAMTAQSTAQEVAWEYQGVFNRLRGEAKPNLQ